MPGPMPSFTRLKDGQGQAYQVSWTWGMSLNESGQAARLAGVTPPSIGWQNPTSGGQAEQERVSEAILSPAAGCGLAGKAVGQMRSPHRPVGSCEPESCHSESNATAKRQKGKQTQWQVSLGQTSHLFIPKGTCVPDSSPTHLLRGRISK